MKTDENPPLLAKIKKKLNTLTLNYQGDKLELDIIDDEVDLIAVDIWITHVLVNIHDKVELRKRLSGGKDDSNLLG